VKYQEKEIIWDYVLFLKTRELAHYLIGKRKWFDFKEPEHALDRIDSEEVRKKLLSPLFGMAEEGILKRDASLSEEECEGSDTVSGEQRGNNTIKIKSNHFHTFQTQPSHTRNYILAPLKL
jgi:hypothetical protein